MNNPTQRRLTDVRGAGVVSEITARQSLRHGIRRATSLCTREAKVSRICICGANSK
ncbi:MAG: hypothetical protein ACI4SJ_05065 [Candidatus Avispirillum sp.]